MNPHDSLMYENGKIRITRNIFTNGQGEQFIIPSIRGIRDEHHGKPAGVLVVAVILLGISSVFHPFLNSQYVFAGIGGLLMAWYVTRKEYWRIYLSTQQGETEAFRTRDEAEFRDVSRTLKSAIAMASAG